MLKLFTRIRIKLFLIGVGLALTLLAPARQEPQSAATLAVGREHFLQKAIELRSREDYQSAIVQLDSILQYDAADAPVLLLKGDLCLQARAYSIAVASYRQLLPLQFEHTQVQINLSYALFMDQHPAQALVFARQAWNENSLHVGAIVNYFNAMLWNLKTKEAGRFLKQQQKLLSPAQVLVLKARLYTSSGNYNEGLNYYDSLVKSYPDKYHVQEYAEVLLGKKEISLSEATMQEHDSLFTSNEYQAYNHKLKATQLQTIGSEFVYFKDVAGNIRTENSVYWQQNEDRNWRIRLSAGTANYRSANKENTHAQFGQLHIDQKWSRAWKGETDLWVRRINPTNGALFTGITGQQRIQYQPNDRKMLGVFYSADILNYTASLLGKNIRSNNAGYLAHIMLSGRTGIYSQGSLGFLTDRNRRSQFFGSVYHLFRTAPTLKGGVNFSALHFADSSIKTYFSPNRYLSSELFVDYSARLKQLPDFSLNLQMASGAQQIESGTLEAAFRFQAECIYRSGPWESAIRYQTSNIASNNGTGYTYNWFTLRAAWHW